MKKKKSIQYKGEGLLFPFTYSKGVEFRWVEFKRKILADKWKYIAVISIAGLAFSLFYNFHFFSIIKAATYGFNQTDWSEGASTSAVAIHDNNQNEYKKYYSKDTNINTSTNGQINLSNASTTIEETNTSDFNEGSFGNLLDISNNSISFDITGLHLCQNKGGSLNTFGTINDLNYCYFGTQTYSACRSLCSDDNMSTYWRQPTKTEVYNFLFYCGGGPITATSGLYYNWTSGDCNYHNYGGCYDQCSDSWNRGCACIFR